MDTADETLQPIVFTEDEVKQTPILEYFSYLHLPPWGQTLSRPFAAHARRIIDTVPMNAERTAGLRKLLEAKDCIVRAGKPK